MSINVKWICMLQIYIFFWVCKRAISRIFFWIFSFFFNVKSWYIAKDVNNIPKNNKIAFLSNLIWGGSIFASQWKFILFGYGFLSKCILFWQSSSYDSRDDHYRQLRSRWSGSQRQNNKNNDIVSNPHFTTRLVKINTLKYLETTDF